MSNEYKPATILVVDDVPDNIDVVAGILKQDYKVRAATSGERALKIINSDTPPDLVLLDIMMPEMNGFQVCQQVKANPDTQDIPVIFLSAMDADTDIVQGLELGAVDYVTKPPTPEVLKARVATHVRLSHEKQLIIENASLREDVERITRHDLKNPLGIIMGYSSMLAEDDSLDKVHRESARFMEEAAYKMMDLINNSLNLYKIEQGSYTFEPKPISLVKIVERCISESTTLASNLGVELQFTAHDRDFEALGEELLSYSLVSNLIRNAIEASPRQGRVEIFIRKGDHALVCVHNEGVIPKAIRENFFDKYVTSGKKQGTGLGTYSARLMAEVQNGQIEFETSKEHGTTLKVLLPLA